MSARWTHHQDRVQTHFKAVCDEGCDFGFLNLDACAVHVERTGHGMSVFNANSIRITGTPVGDD